MRLYTVLHLVVQGDIQQAYSGNAAANVDAASMGAFG